MKILQFDSVGGASGDMILGALLDLGIDRKRFDTEIAKLDLDGYACRVEPCTSHGLRGTRVTIDTKTEGHHHRHLPDIVRIIDQSNISNEVKMLSKKVFQRLAQAEAQVHGMGIDEVHFHEVGAVDSIVDIVGCCMALSFLDVDEVAVRPLPIGHGTVSCAHGLYPVPAPGTLALLGDMPVVQTEEPFELVTPTGVALLSTWKTIEAIPPGSLIRKVGYSFGHRVLNNRPNLLRASLYEIVERKETPDCIVLECHVDDTQPELMGHLAEELLTRGALDAFTTPVYMKKQRPGILLTVLVAPEHRDQIVNLIFQECTTFGIRESVSHRHVLERRHQSVGTPFGDIPVKIGSWKGEDLTFSPEMDDCIRRSKELGVPVREVYEAAQRAVSGMIKKTRESTA